MGLTVELHCENYYTYHSLLCNGNRIPWLRIFVINLFEKHNLTHATLGEKYFSVIYEIIELNVFYFLKNC